jgi:DNA-binding transcriptional LysR family regulator
MNLRQLEYFVAVVEQGSFTAASELLFVSQPSLSQQIAALERELGGQLLERLPRGVRLTPAGESLLGEARATLRHADRARRAARMALALDAGQLEVAAATSAAAGILPRVLHDWLGQHPAIEVSLLEYPHRSGLDEAVRDGAGDIAVGSLPSSWPGSIQRLGWEEFVVVLPDGDPLLDQKSVALTDLAERRWVHFTRAHGLAEVLDFCCGTAGFAPRVALRTSQVTAAPLFAAAGIGPTLVPSHIVPAALAHLARPAGPRPIRTVCAFTRGEWSALTSSFLESLRDFPWGPKPRGALDLG